MTGRVAIFAGFAFSLLTLLFGAAVRGESCPLANVGQTRACPNGQCGIQTCECFVFHGMEQCTANSCGNCKTTIDRVVKCLSCYACSSCQYNACDGTICEAAHWSDCDSLACERDGDHGSSGPAGSSGDAAGGPRPDPDGGGDGDDDDDDDDEDDGGDCDEKVGPHSIRVPTGVVSYQPRRFDANVSVNGGYLRLDRRYSSRRAFMDARREVTTFYSDIEGGALLSWGGGWYHQLDSHMRVYDQATNKFVLESPDGSTDYLDGFGSTNWRFSYDPNRYLRKQSGDWWKGWELVDADGSVTHFTLFMGTANFATFHIARTVSEELNQGYAAADHPVGLPLYVYRYSADASAAAPCKVATSTDVRIDKLCLITAGRRAAAEGFIYFSGYSHADSEPATVALITEVQYGRGPGIGTPSPTGKTVYTYADVDVIAGGATVGSRRLLSRVDYHAKNATGEFELFDQESYDYTHQSYLRPDLGAVPAENPYSTSVPIEAKRDTTVATLDLLRTARDAAGNLIERYEYDARGRGAASFAAGELLRISYWERPEDTLVRVDNESIGWSREYLVSPVSGQHLRSDGRLLDISEPTGCSQKTVGFERTDGWVTARTNGDNSRTAFKLDSRGRVVWAIDNWINAELPPALESINPLAGPFRIQKFEYFPALDGETSRNPNRAPPVLESRVHSVLCTNGAASLGLTCETAAFSEIPAVIRDFDPDDDDSDSDGRPYNDSPLSARLRLPRRVLTTGYQLTDATTGIVGGVMRSTTYTHGPGGRLEQVVAPDGTIYEYTYYPDTDPASTRGRLHSVFVNDVEVTTYSQYDAAGRPTTVLDVEHGLETHNTYDLSGRLIQRKICSACGLANEAARVSGWEYDGAGRLVRVTASVGTEETDDGTVAEYAYTPPAGIVPANSPTLCAISDVPTREACVAALGYLGRPTQVWQKSRAGSAEHIRSLAETAYGAAGDPVTTSTFNAAMGLRRRQDSQYDGLGRLQRLLEFSSSSSEASVVRDHYYDLMGRLQATTSREVHGSLPDYESGRDAPDRRLTYDALGRLWTVTEGAGTAEEATVTYGYDAHDNLASVTDGDGRVTRYVYDDFGQLTAVQSPDSGTTLFEYDSGGRLRRKVDTEGTMIEYTYDTRGRLVSEEYAAQAGGAPTERDTEYYYDSLPAESGLVTGEHNCGAMTVVVELANLSGRLVWVRQGQGSRSVFYSYTPFGEVSAVYEQDGATCDPCSLAITRYEYDSLGRLLSMKLPVGMRVAYDYADGGSEPTSVNLGPAAQTLIEDVAYDVDGSLMSYRAGSLVYSAERDLSGRIVSKSLSRAAPIFTYSIPTRDRFGNVTSVAIVPGNQTASYTYDGQQRLTAVSTERLRGYQDCNYGYDAAGNRISEVCNGLPLAYDYCEMSGGGDNNTLESVTWETDDLTQCGSGTRVTQLRAFGRDDLGRITTGYTSKYPAPEDVFVLAYDAAGQIASALTPTGEYLYEYDHRNLRVVKRGPDETTRFVYDAGGRLAVEWDEAEGQQYVYLGGELVAVVAGLSDGGQNLAYLAATDQLGTPLRLLDTQNGSVAWAADQEAFGNASVYVPGGRAPPSIDVNIRFPGQYADQETGLHYNWHRYYDPNLGRYLQPDPMIAGFNFEGRLWLDTGVTVYSYARNSPMEITDATGLQPGTCEMCRTHLDTCFRKCEDNPEYNPYTNFPNKKRQCYDRDAARGSDLLQCQMRCACAFKECQDERCHYTSTHCED